MTTQTGSQTEIGVAPAGNDRPAARTLIPILGGALLLAGHVAYTLVGGAGAFEATAAGLLGLGLLGYGCVGQLREREAGRHMRAHASATGAQLEGLIDASPLAIVSGDLEGRITLWSQAAEEMLGWSEEEVLGRPYPAVPPEAADRWAEMRRRVLAGEVVRGVRSTRTTRSGEALDVSVSAAPTRDGAGEITGTVALIESLEGAAEAKRQVEKLESQLRQAQKLEVVGRLAAGIAHDFNNLLTAIRGNAELILASEPSTDVEPDLQEISRSAERAAALTRQLLTFTHQGAVENRPLDVSTLVRGMETLMQRLVGETMELRVEVSVDAGAVIMDPNQLEQVLMNLVVNARDALPDGGRITVHTHAVDVGPQEAASLPYEVRPGPFARVTVMDNGVGMEQETIDRIFEPFFTTKPVGVGTGLGLSTVYSIVKQARGHIRVESEPGGGTTFQVYLPRHDGEAVDQEREELVTTELNGGTETVLVVEDEAAVLSLAERTLSRQGYTVLTALSGREALSLALKHPGEIHVLFCDVVMPDLTGREVAERVKAARQDIEILMTSGYGERQLADDGVMDGARFLPKPYTPKELASQVRAILEPSTPR